MFRVCNSIAATNSPKAPTYIRCGLFLLILRGIENSSTVIDMKYEKLFKDHTQELRETIDRLDQYYEQVVEVGKQFKKAFDSGNKILIAGNGGSGAQALHLSDEMVGRYRNDRQAYPAISLTADGAVITCIGNDFGYDNVFGRQVAAFGQPGDIFVGLTTSGASENILKAAAVARERGMLIIGFMGEGGVFQELCDFVLQAPSKKSAVVQEMHLHAIHLLCELFEEPISI